MKFRQRKIKWKFAIVPVQLNDGSWIWWQPYYDIYVFEQELVFGLRWKYKGKVLKEDLYAEP